MSFTEKDKEKLAFAEDVRGLEEWMNQTCSENIVMMHNELAQNSEDYREIAKVTPSSTIIPYNRDAVQQLMGDMSVDDVIKALFDGNNGLGALLTAVVNYPYSEYLIWNDDNTTPLWHGITRHNEEWHHIVHSLSVFLAIRGKEPIDMFPGKLKSKEATNG